MSRSLNIETSIYNTCHWQHVPKASISHSNQCSRAVQVINKGTADNYVVICMVPSIAAEILLSGFEICSPGYCTCILD